MMYSMSSDSRKLTEKGASLWKPEKKKKTFMMREAFGLIYP